MEGQAMAAPIAVNGLPSVSATTDKSPPSPDSTPQTQTAQSSTQQQQTLYLIRLSQSHESFRMAELESLASYLNIPLQIHEYSPASPFCIVSLPTQHANTISPSPNNQSNNNDPHILAKTLLSRSILSKSLYELYATSDTYTTLHTTIQSLPPQTFTPYSNVTFKFSVDAFRGKRSMSDQRRIVEGFRYLPFRGRIAMSGAEEEFVVCEEWGAVLSKEEHEGVWGKNKIVNSNNSGNGNENGNPIANVIGDVDVDVEDAHVDPTLVVDENEPGTTNANGLTQPAKDITKPERKPKRIFFGRYLGGTQRELAEKHDLKRRPYISTTSMDAELALVTALLAHAGPGKLMLDPFVGTGGFMVAAGELGAVTFGSDIDGRSFRGKGLGVEKGVLANFRKYGIVAQFGDCITADLTHSPFRVPGVTAGVSGDRAVTRMPARTRRWLDGIICDPPYGVREGLKVLGRRHHDGPSENGRIIHEGPYFIDGVESHLLPGFVAPKRPYSFNRMLGDILDFAAGTLVDRGRLAFWMPCANEAEEEFGIPRHPAMELKHVCVQAFNKWSRRLLVYERVAGDMPNSNLVDGLDASNIASLKVDGHHADDLNQFRRMYFQGFNNNSTSTAKNDKG